MRGRPRDSRGAPESCGRRHKPTPIPIEIVLVSGRLSTGLDIGWPDIVERIALRVSRWGFAPYHGQAPDGSRATAPAFGNVSRPRVRTHT